MNRFRGCRIHPIVLLILLSLGCHSAGFQTAKIRDGVNATIGVTAVNAVENPDVSDYSIFVKGEAGRTASRARPGYSLALTLIAPFRNRYRDLLVSHDMELGTFPNEWAGVMPEVKVQCPRILPVDIALDFRLMTYMPERLALLTSVDISEQLTLYQAYSYTTAIGHLLSLGAEVNVTKRVSLLLEHALWLSEHDYPDDYTGSVARYPSSIGIALSYNLPRSPRQHDPHKYTLHVHGVRSCD